MGKSGKTGQSKQDQSEANELGHAKEWTKPAHAGQQSYKLRHADLSRDESAKLPSLSFTYVFNYEWRAIAARRASLELPGLSVNPSLEGIEIKSAYHVSEDIPCLGLNGLALSGGGIRSAAFCIGVTQAMDAILVGNDDERDKAKTLYQHMDYVSSVSGGGYAGATLLNAQTQAPNFAYPSRLERNESAILRHIRDHSNYLFPEGGFTEKLRVLASYLRGIAANIPVVIVFLALMLMVTTFANPQLSNLNQPWLDLLNIENDRSFFKGAPGFLQAMFQPNSGFFGFSLLTALAIPVVFLLWSLGRSLLFRPQFEMRTPGTALAASVIALFLLVLAAEIQPRMISGVHSNYCDGLVTKGVDEISHKPGKSEIAYAAALCEDLGQSWKRALTDKIMLIEEAKGKNGNVAAPKTGFAFIVEWIQRLTVYIAAFTGFFAALRGVFGSSEGHQNQTQGVLGAFANYSSMVSQVIAGLLLPLAIWIAYLYLAFWSIPGMVQCGCGYAFMHAPAWFAGIMEAVKTCAEYLNTFVGSALPIETNNWDVSIFYLLILVFFGLIAMLLRPNANSPHNLYRDSLARAFIVQSDDGVATSKDPDDHRIKLSDTRPHCETPIHLFNAALNLQGSTAKNGRGRNASFFTFSDAYCGSVETGYVATVDLEAAEYGKFTLSSAMAISAAAASSAMGSQTMRPLAATFALLNVRLGYWLPNPYNIAKQIISYSGATPENVKAVSWLKNNSFTVFMRELTGIMGEQAEQVYLSDGGHIENLGVYELLKRRCKFIVVVDAEADPQLTFSSFSAVQRYARIDLGTLIDVSTDKIRQATMDAKREWHPPVTKAAAARASGKSIATPSWEELKQRPHCAIGTIRYPKDKHGNAQTGLMFYIKLSVTGDENDYVKEYARKYSKFPHETTGDQFFSEEQFEAYRALGFHATFKALLGAHGVQHRNEIVDLVDPEFSSPYAVKLFRELFPNLMKR